MIIALRDENVGGASDREIALLRLLTPHIRKAVQIGELFELRQMEITNLQATLDTLNAGVVIVSSDREILIRNIAATRKLEAGGVLAERNNRLFLYDSACDANMSAGLECMQKCTDRGVAAAPLTLRLTSASTPPLTAHLVPLSTGPIRSRLEPRALAALIIAPDPNSTDQGLASVAAIYDLTEAEGRLFAAITKGQGLSETAAVLGVSINTGKTQLKQIFDKTGTRRQAELTALACNLAPRASPHVPVPVQDYC